MTENELKHLNELEELARHHQAVADRLAAEGDMEGYRRWSEHAAYFRSEAYCLKNGLTTRYSYR